MAYMASEPWTEIRLRTPESAASSSRHARPYAVAVVPAQPYPCKCIPSTPSLPSSCASSRAGIEPDSYQSARWGRIRSSANRRTVSRIVRSSSAISSSVPKSCSGVCGVATPIPSHQGGGPGDDGGVLDPVTKTGYVLDFADDFDGERLDERRWLPYYLPQWSSRQAAAARYRLGDGRLRLRIDADQPPWCPEFDGDV